jgi:hypothetical protein
MNCYVDSSLVLRHLLTEDRGFLLTADYEKVGASELLVIECPRIMERYRLEGLVDDVGYAELRQSFREIVSGMYILAMTSSIKRRAAEPFPTVIGTLEALHVSTAMAWREMALSEDFALFTYDNQMAICAKALGIAVLP